MTFKYDTNDLDFLLSELNNSVSKLLIITYTENISQKSIIKKKAFDIPLDKESKKNIYIIINSYLIKNISYEH